MFNPPSIGKCCGCMACQNVCLVNAIGVKTDKLGFHYPYITNNGKCINCDRCNRVCIAKIEVQTQKDVGAVLAGYSTDFEIRKCSSSGGIFPVLCKYVLDHKGVCYGVGFNTSFDTEHIRINRIEDLHTICTSKYTESSLSNVFRMVKKDLDQGIMVLFSGTPCQSRGLRSFLPRNYDNLLLIDLFCYGIPSPVVWRKWLGTISQGKKPVFVNFRDKEEGWEKYSLRIVYSDGTEYRKNKTEDLFLKTFTKGGYLRQSCYECAYKGFPRVSDITLGDFQEILELDPSVDTKMGWSMIKINTDKGQKTLDAVKDNLFVNIVEAEQMNSLHPNIGTPVAIHPNRRFIAAHINDYEIESLLIHKAGITLGMKFRNHIFRTINKFKTFTSSQLKEKS